MLTNLVTSTNSRKRHNSHSLSLYFYLFAHLWIVKNWKIFMLLRFFMWNQIWKFESIKSTNHDSFMASAETLQIIKMIKLAVFETPKLTKLISRKIFLASKIFNFQVSGKWNEFLQVTKHKLSESSNGRPYLETFLSKELGNVLFSVTIEWLQGQIPNFFGIFTLFPRSSVEERQTLDLRVQMVVDFRWARGRNFFFFFSAKIWCLLPPGGKNKHY